MPCIYSHTKHASKSTQPTIY